MLLTKRIKKFIVTLLCVSLILTNFTPAFAEENKNITELEEVVDEVIENEESIVSEDDFEKTTVEEEIEEGRVSSSSEIIEEDIEEFEEDIDLSLVEEPEEDLVEVVEELEKSTDEIVGEPEIEASPSEINEELEDIDNLNVSENSNIASISEIETNENLEIPLFGGSLGDTIYWYYATWSSGFGTYGQIRLTTVYTTSFSDEGHSFTFGGVYNDYSSITGIPSFVPTKLKILDDIYPTSLQRYFYNANMPIEGLEKIHTDSTTDMSYMFANNHFGNGLDNTDISLLNTTGITDMSHMFEGCTIVKSINVSSFDTSSVTTMDSMFSGCSSLKTIIGKDGFVPSGATGNDMFLNCDSLLGCKGTTYSATKTDKSMAIIDKYNGVTPGYFSKKIVATLNGYEYTSLYNAINDVNDSETIQVIDDIDEIIETESITIDNGKTFTINFKESSGTQHSFTYGAKNVVMYSSSEPVFHISNGSKVTINDMNYENVPGSVTANDDTLFKIEGSLTNVTLNNFTNINLPTSGKKDKFIEISEGTISLNNSTFITKENANIIEIKNSGICNVDNCSFTVNNYYIYNGGGIFYVNVTCTDKNNTKISVNDSSCFGTYMVGLQGNATVDVSGTTTFKGGYGPILVVGGNDSDITLNDFTSDSTDSTGGTVVGIVVGTNTTSRLVNKAKIYGTAYKYKAGRLSSDVGSVPATTSDMIIYSGKFGPDTGQTPANKKEIENLLAPMKRVVEITDPTDLAAGYYYKIENIPVQCKIGSTEYGDLQSAINAVQNDETIVMQQNVTYDTPILINNGKKFTIDFLNSSIYYTFRWYDMMGSQTDKDCFTINSGDVTINNMQYLVGLGENRNRVFKVNNGTLTLNNFTSFTSGNIADCIVYNNGGIVNINNGHIETIADEMFIQNAGVLNIGGSSLSCKINNENHNIIYVGEGNTDVNYDAGTVNINDGDFQVAQLLQINAKAKININKAKSDNGYGYIFVKEYGKKSNISVNDYTLDTYGDAFIKIWNTTMDTKIAINGGKYKYGQGYFCKDESSGSPLFEASLKGGLFGPDSGDTTDAYNEISNLLAPNYVLQTLPSTHPEYVNGYYYEVVYMPPTPTPTPKPYNPGSGSTGNSNGGFSGGSPKYDLKGDIIGPSGNIDYNNLPSTSVYQWNYNTDKAQAAEVKYVQYTDSFVRANNIPVITEWVGVTDEKNSKIVWFRTDMTGKILRNQFVQIGENFYYFDNNGIMVTGDFQINGTTYRFETIVGPTEGRLLSVIGI